jgi:hypothetical protein
VASGRRRRFPEPGGEQARRRFPEPVASRSEAAAGGEQGGRAAISGEQGGRRFPESRAGGRAGRSSGRPELGTLAGAGRAGRPELAGAGRAGGVGDFRRSATATRGRSEN